MDCRSPDHSAMDRRIQMRRFVVGHTRPHILSAHVHRRSSAQCAENCAGKCQCAIYVPYDGVPELRESQGIFGCLIMDFPCCHITALARCAYKIV